MNLPIEDTDYNTNLQTCQSVYDLHRANSILRALQYLRETGQLQ